MTEGAESDTEYPLTIAEDLEDFPYINFQLRPPKRTPELLYQNHHGVLHYGALLALAFLRVLMGLPMARRFRSLDIGRWVENRCALQLIRSSYCVIPPAGVFLNQDCRLLCESCTGSVRRLVGARGRRSRGGDACGIFLRVPVGRRRAAFATTAAVRYLLLAAAPTTARRFCCARIVHTSHGCNFATARKCRGAVRHVILQLLLPGADACYQATEPRLLLVRRNRRRSVRLRGFVRLRFAIDRRVDGLSWIYRRPEDFCFVQILVVVIFLILFGLPCRPRRSVLLCFFRRRGSLRLFPGVSTIFSHLI
mmetsp:Transcript_16994/g.42098  ORF Transcript_16994/g.42098 Transcript_16994/m.42098 type:complete len:308 (+) Transcript_16994:984-1907(+)